MTSYFDKSSGVHLDLKDSQIFNVYTRRSNCPKRLIYSGNDIDKAIDTYNTFKVFKGDYKYVYLQDGTILYRTQGTGVRPSYRGKKLIPNFKKSLLPIRNMPSALLEELKTKNSLLLSPQGSKLSLASTILILISTFCEFSEEERQNIITESYGDIVKYQMLSGGDNTVKIKDYLSSIVKDDDLL